MSAAIVDLLPPEIAGRRRDRRVIVWTAVAVAALVGVLTGVYASQVAAVDAARTERDRVATEVDVRDARVAALQPYADMAARLEARNAVLASAMAPEVSWSRLLNDLALAMPEDASVLTLAATTAEEGTAGAGTPTAGNETAGTGTAGAIGRLDATGYSTSEVSPGVRSVVTALPEVQGLVDPYLSSAEDTDLHGQTVTGFTLGAALDDGVRTHRYDDGLPPEATR